MEKNTEKIRPFKNLIMGIGEDIKEEGWKRYSIQIFILSVFVLFIIGIDLEWKWATSILKILNLITWAGL